MATSDIPIIDKGIQEAYNMYADVFKKNNHEINMHNLKIISKIYAFFLTFLAIGSLATWTVINTLGWAVGIPSTVPITLIGCYLGRKVERYIKNKQFEMAKYIDNKNKAIGKELNDEIKLALGRHTDLAESKSFVLFPNIIMDPVEKVNETYLNSMKIKQEAAIAAAKAAQPKGWFSWARIA